MRSLATRAVAMRNSSMLRASRTPHRALSWTLWIGVVCFVFNIAATATAAPNEPPAKALYTKGSVEYRLGNFGEALGHFRAAYRLSPRPSLIFNMAQTYRQLKRHQEALFNYKLYLSEWQRLTPDKPAPFADEIAGRLKELKAAIAAEKSAEASPEPSNAPTQPSAVSKATTVSQEKSIVPLESTTRPVNASAKATRWYKTWWFWTGLGVIVTAATVGTAVGLTSGTSQPPQGTIPPGVLQF
jgi:tetratricopeptide (TPR) repeat protein